MAEREILILADPPAVAAEAAARFIHAARAGLAARGRFAVALAGGSTPAGLYRLLGQAPYRDQVAWEHTLLFFGDERCVPPDHPDSNYRMVQGTLLAQVPAPLGNVFRMPGELPGETGARQYAQTLAQAFPSGGDEAGKLPVFDLILLGMGDDGHTASLFPGMPALTDEEHTVIFTPVPAYVRPAVARLTLSVPVLNAARAVVFLVAGASKATALAAILGNAANGAALLPAARVRPAAGTLTWLLDAAAAQDLK